MYVIVNKKLHKVRKSGDKHFVLVLDGNGAVVAKRLSEKQKARMAKLKDLKLNEEMVAEYKERAKELVKLVKGMKKARKSTRKSRVRKSARKSARKSRVRKSARKSRKPRKSARKSRVRKSARKSRKPRKSARKSRVRKSARKSRKPRKSARKSRVRKSARKSSSSSSKSASKKVSLHRKQRANEEFVKLNDKIHSVQYMDGKYIYFTVGRDGLPKDHVLSKDKAKAVVKSLKSLKPSQKAIADFNKRDAKLQEAFKMRNKRFN